MDDISPVGRLEFVPGRRQTAILPKQGEGGKRRKENSAKAATGEDEFHRHDSTIEDSAESLNKDHIDLKV
jgi:hypothetical protein